ncbi:bifunctional adenosylcobinamide kinase/adenosylcobinamide-phosphate guanylyltransferase [Alloalcanivorax profundimaris]|uniref:bifunctional adenosylcobinamide kinase/adenosylcobinamide-phosphate guanylyltransferase n=1 Tax=Alloalcanivorax profundimaris TaxID=2735259 RepID=UPI0018883298|nr:bifunctional adenosylcobinamide kinase/adenosylcobinamide-phosphate guanylyltransferase [Alloalcanivorax profundimaris]MBF1801961.1 bifunctional adenosylcobinamide kinase/adenosylcobinamide-phosphate guanylyltransferase [Alloalcanivorax profundimaris]MCQ6263601.1 bifunctional adenosylcobinamide kinase/adenosylcobinamide-phosphate guanylyltransferase [Alcanivorax sp. MM125-6]
MATELILGGVRSGKSALAERLAAAHSRVLYLATAEPGDGEMRERIRRHRQRRPAHWELLEEPLALGDALAARADAGSCILIDCMSLWVSNLLHAGDAVFERQRRALLEALPACPGTVIIVSNEVGLGLVGMDPLSRRFADELGWLNQALAERAERVILTAAGLPLVLKGAALSQ